MAHSTLQLCKLWAVWEECNRVEQIVCMSGMNPCEPGLCVLDKQVVALWGFLSPGSPTSSWLAPAVLSGRTGIWAVNNVMVKPTALSRGHQYLENKEAEAQPKMLFSRGKTSVLAWNTSPLELLPRAEDVAVKLNEHGWLWDSVLAAPVRASPFRGGTCLRA